MRSYFSHSVSRLMLGTAVAALAMPAAFAQNETVTVTGTSIRGQAPVGANVITVDRAAIDTTGAQTVQQLLTSIPQLTNFGNAGQGSTARGGFGTADASGSAAPTIHSLGASASNQTLILINGHRIPPSGLTHVLVDPSSIPTSALQRVEVLPDGASSVYGSDATAGVLNFITRKEYDGWETGFQYGFGDHYRTTNVSQVFGHSWESGSVLAAYNYSSRSSLQNSDRDFIANDLRRFGGLNNGNYTCRLATIAGSGTTGSSAATAGIFLYPYTNGRYTESSFVPGQGVTPANGTFGDSQHAPCDNISETSLLPSETRNSMIVSLRQALNDRVSLTADMVYASRLSSSRNSHGSVTGMAFGPGGSGGPAFGSNQRNPFYQSGTSGLTASQFVRLDLTDLLDGVSTPTTKGGDQIGFVALGLDVDLGSGWAGTVSATTGQDNSSARDIGGTSAAEALLALNGTVSQNGTGATSVTTSALADPNGLGTIVSVTRALTTANALDVWNPKATNRTSATVLRSLVDASTNRTTQQTMNDVMIKIDGPVMDLPAGTVKVAFGGEYYHHNFLQQNATNNGTGPSSTSSNFLRRYAPSTTYGAFAEFLIPVINQDMGIPLVQKFDLDVSGRWDHYDSFGNTQNPKISFSWILFDGFQARGSMGSSFTAPVVTNLPSGFGPRSVANNNNGGATVPATHVNAPGSWCAAGCVLDAAHPGITLGGANDNQPATGLTYSAGFDWDVGTTLSPLNSFFDILNGLNVSVTYWQAKSLGLMTTPTIVNEANVPGLQNQLQLAPPGGWTPTSPEVLAAIAGATPPTTPLNPTIWFIYRNILQNAFNIQANGIDFDVRYRLPTDDFGTFTFGINGAELLRFDENNGKSTDGNWTSFLNGYQVNTTFSSLQFHARATFGWSMDPFSADIAVNFTNPYWNTQAGNPNVPVPGKTTTPTQKIEANYTIDANFSYNVPEDLFPGWTNGLQIFVNSQNVFDEKPPFYNATLYTGYDSGNSSPLGRIVNIGFRKKW